MSSILETVPQRVNPGYAHAGSFAGVNTAYWHYGAGESLPVFPEKCFESQGLSGDSPAIILVHGFRGDHHGLELIANHLLQEIPGAHIMIPDIPGFGSSDTLPGNVTIDAYTSWLHEFIAQVSNYRNSQVLVVGHSFGSIVCSAYAARFSASLAALSLINPISEPALKGKQRVGSLLASGYYALGAALPENLGYPLLRSQAVTRVTSEFMMRTKDRELRRFINGQHASYFGSFSSRRAVLQAYKVSIERTAAEFAPEVRVPTQMLVAAKDDLGTVGTASAMYAALGSHSAGQVARMDIIPEVGHLIHYETPRYAAYLLRSFMDQLRFVERHQ